jgi:hypothetical protein
MYLLLGVYVVVHKVVVLCAALTQRLYTTRKDVQNISSQLNSKMKMKAPLSTPCRNLFLTRQQDIFSIFPFGYTVYPHIFFSRTLYTRIL